MIRRSSLKVSKNHPFDIGFVESKLHSCHFDSDSSQLKIVNYNDHVVYKQHKTELNISILLLINDSIFCSFRDNFIVKQLSANDLSFINMLFSFSMQVKKLTSNSKNSKIFGLSEDGAIKGFDLLTEDLLIFESQDNFDVINISASDQHLLSLSSSGELNLWLVASRRIISTVNLIHQHLEFVLQPNFCEMQNNLIISYPFDNMVRLINEADSNNLEMVWKTLESNSPGCSIISSHIFTNSNMNYVCASNSIGELFIWDLESSKLIRKDSLDKPITRFISNTAKNSIILIDSINSIHDLDASEFVKDIKMSEDLNRVPFEIIELNDDVVSPVTKKPKSKMTKKNFELENLSSDEDGENNPPLIEKSKHFSTINKKKKLEVHESDDESYSNYSECDQEYEIPQSCNTFMPNSTSFRKETQSKIFLDYNSVGTIELTRILQQKSDDEYFDDSEIKKREESTIVVKFHDSTFHQTVYLKNSNNYSIGRLSKSILVLIGNDEEEVKIYAQLFDTWTSLRVWNHSIPSNNGENRVKCFCISQDHIFIATQQNDVHILNFSGHQIDIFSCRAPILSIVASAIQKNEKNLLCVVYEDMNCDVFEYSNWEMRMSYETSLPISSALLWVSFCSSYGILSCSDVQGPVKIFNPDTRVWYPIYGFKDQKIWPININVGKNAIYGIPLENKISAEPIVDQLNVVKKFAFNSYSMLNNNPNIMPKELQEAWTAKIVKSAITSCKGSGEKSMEKSILANLVRAFDALAVANEHQAFEIVKLMPNDNAKKICMKYAQKKGNNALSDQIADYLSSRLTNPDHFDN